MAHSEWPVAQIDHINRKRDDNRIVNLREADAFENAQNKGALKTSRSGVKGVRFKKGAWEASCMVRGKRCYLGRHPTKEAASAAYASFSAAHAGPFSNPA